MKIKDYNGKDIKWTVQGKKQNKVSSLHQRVRNILNEHYPLKYHEEVLLPGSKPPLRFDFVLPDKRMLIEVQGSQHLQYSSLFHKNKRDLLRQIDRDSKKFTWCEENELNLVTLFYNEDDDEWMRKIFS